MKPLIIPALFVSLFAVHPAYATGAYDLQCLLENGEQMTLSHASHTVYISFEKPGGDAEEGGSVIKLDVAAGEVEQSVVSKNAAGVTSVGLRGTSADIEGAIGLTYSEYQGTKEVAYIAMNSLGQETGTVYCKPETIKTGAEFLTKGIVVLQQPKGANTPEQPAVQKASKPPFQVQFGSTGRTASGDPQYGIVHFSFTENNVVLKSIVVNRGNCKQESVGNRMLPATYNFGQTGTFKYVGCANILEVVINTNYGSWTVNQ